eukprot:764902-Hanusia_phi.AAC.4
MIGGKIGVIEHEWEESERRGRVGRAGERLFQLLRLMFIIVQGLRCIRRSLADERQPRVTSDRLRIGLLSLLHTASMPLTCICACQTISVHHWLPPLFDG